MTNKMSNVVVWAVVAMAAVPPVAQASQAAEARKAQASQTTQAATPADSVQVQTQDTYVVGRAMPPETPGSQRIDISLEQAIERALEKNLDIQREKLSPQMQDYTLAAFRAAFRPTLNANA